MLKKRLNELFHLTEVEQAFNGLGDYGDPGLLDGSHRVGAAGDDDAHVIPVHVHAQHGGIRLPDFEYAVETRRQKPVNGMVNVVLGRHRDFPEIGQDLAGARPGHLPDGGQVLGHEHFKRVDRSTVIAYHVGEAHRYPVLDLDDAAELWAHGNALLQENAVDGDAAGGGDARLAAADSEAVQGLALLEKLNVRADRQAAIHDLLENIQHLGEVLFIDDREVDHDLPVSGLRIERDAVHDLLDTGVGEHHFFLYFEHGATHNLFIPKGYLFLD